MFSRGSAAAGFAAVPEAGSIPATLLGVSASLDTCGSPRSLRPPATGSLYSGRKAKSQWVHALLEAHLTDSHFHVKWVEECEESMMLREEIWTVGRAERDLISHHQQTSETRLTTQHEWLSPGLPVAA